MKYLIPMLIVFTGVDALNGLTLAGEVEIVNVDVSCAKDCRFSVTLRHADQGWDHYANQWDVVTLDGKLLKSRVLIHPHVNEQPFTRSLSGVSIPPGTKAVKIRARDLVHGYSSQEYFVDLSSN